jgi:peptidoglycan-N-acetylglucosamine deacetylase
MDLRFLETPRTNWLVRGLFPLLTWKKPRSSQSVFLTFDDGPTSGITEQILDILDQYGAKATFFCVGEAAERSPQIVSRIVGSGHSIGNHTYSHLAGWNCSIRTYLDDISRCDQVLPEGEKTRLRPFRPPYAQLGLLQGLVLFATHKIVFWDVNSMDYRQEQSPDQISKRVLDHIQSGSIVLMHDSQTAGPRTIQALPSIIRGIQERGWDLRAL